MPADIDAFVALVFDVLGGSAFTGYTISRLDPGWEDQQRAAETNRYLTSLAEDAVRHVQLHEAIGRAPTLKEFGEGSFAYRAASLAEDPQRAWLVYARAVEDALHRVR